MAEVKVKCRYCGERIPKSEAYVFEGKQKQYTCPQHAKLYQAQLDTKTKSSQELREITDYLLQIYQTHLGMSSDDIKWSRLVKEINELEQSGYKKTGILLTLQYATEFLKIQWKEQYGIKYIVESHYNDAKEYYITTVKKNQLCEDFEDDVEKTVTINPQQSLYNRFMIDMNDLNER